MTDTTESKTDRIRGLNDAFRRTFVGGAVMITAGRRSDAPRSTPFALAEDPKLRRLQSRITIRIRNTTSALSMKPASAAFSRSTTTIEKPSSVRLIRPIPPSRPAS